MIPYIKFPEWQIYRNRSRLMVARTWGRGRWGVTADEDRFSPWANKRVPRLDSGDDCTTP